MSNTWVIADPHFGHVGVTKFTNYDGSKMRPWDDVSEMDEALISNWNNVVEDRDRVYLLGDVAMTKRGFMGAVPRLKGRKVLVKGNHDIEKLSLYQQYFDDIRAYVVKKGFIMSHIPIHPGSMGRWSINIHGHTHCNYIQLGAEYDEGALLPDPRYVCVSVEQINYTPKLLSKILQENKIVPDTDGESLGLRHRGGQPSRQGDDDLVRLSDQLRHEGKKGVRLAGAIQGLSK